MRIENRLQRAQLRARSKNGFGGDSQITIDDQLTRLEEDIRRLKIEFDIYFNGASKRPPYDTKGRVETILKRLGDDRSLTFAERYRFNTLMARYNVFRDLWRRTMQGREEGKDPVSAARATAKREAVESFTKTTLVCLDASREVETVKNLYDALVDAKTKCGESTEDFSFPRFHRLIASKAESLKARLKCERVSFSVDVEGGHVSFKARAERD
ncbi:MAG TPA: MXAN_5187 C-terminal domain-containing protein [Pyrinomonadaceae bacterium]|nr:MXAN_5187 C-terminal domain-containing protein [Pyrinomonadaceae bacterium]